jgi:hypothetical protein
MTPDEPEVTLNTLHGDLGGLHEQMGGMRTEMGGLRTEMGGLRSEMGGLRTEMGGLRSEMGGLRSEMRELKVAVVTGFASLPTRESSEEMIRLLRENNRLQEQRFSQLDLRLREQHLETQQVLHALVEGQRSLLESHRVVHESLLGLTAEIRALVARLDAMIRGRRNGEPPTG